MEYVYIMKKTVRTLVSPILDFFESGDEPYHYEKSHRLILKVVGGLFLFLSFCSVVAGLVASLPAALFPVLIFFAVGFTCTVVATMGSDRAVAKMWGNRGQQDQQ